MASKIKNANNTLFSTSVKFHDICETLGDVHHIFPRKYLQDELNATRGVYNQLANYTHLEKRINIKIGKRPPFDYFTEAKNATLTGAEYFGNINNIDDLMANLSESCIPEGIFEMDASNYEEFLEQRRILMANKIKEYFLSL